MMRRTHAGLRPWSLDRLTRKFLTSIRALSGRAGLSRCPLSGNSTSARYRMGMTVEKYKVATAAIAGGVIVGCISAYTIAIQVSTAADPDGQNFWPYPWLAIPAVVAAVAATIWLVIAFGPVLPKRGDDPASVPMDRLWTSPPHPAVMTRATEINRKWQVALLDGQIVGAISRIGDAYKVEGPRRTYAPTLDEAVKALRGQLPPDNARHTDPSVKDRGDSVSRVRAAGSSTSAGHWAVDDERPYIPPQSATARVAVELARQEAEKELARRDGQHDAASTRDVTEAIKRSKSNDVPTTPELTGRRTIDPVTEGYAEEIDDGTWLVYSAKSLSAGRLIPLGGDGFAVEPLDGKARHVAVKNLHEGISALVRDLL